MSTDYQRIEKAIRFIAANRLDQPDLDQVAAAVGLSPYHFQRLFTRWAGVSPKRFLGYLTLQHARQLLTQNASVLDTALEVGLSGPSRLHDLFVSLTAMTPGETKDGGAGLAITYATLDTPFGPAAVMRTARGICGLEFLSADESAETLTRARWPGARISPGSAENGLADRLFGTSKSVDNPIQLHVKGTNFQVQVWRALLELQPGALSTYKRIAENVCDAKAARAVGGAIGKNPVAFVIPCHRVIKENGVIEGYRWDSVRKQALIAWESAHDLSSRDTV